MPWAGVLHGKLVIGGLLRDQGVCVETISNGQNATAMSPFKDFDAQQLKHVNAVVDWVYDGFIERVRAEFTAELPASMAANVAADVLQACLSPAVAGLICICSVRCTGIYSNVIQNVQLGSFSES